MVIRQQTSLLGCSRGCEAYRYGDCAVGVAVGDGVTRAVLADNRDRILEAARAAFAADGLEVTMRIRATPRSHQPSACR